MPGIVGVFNKKSDKQLLLSMINSVKHYECYKVNLWNDENFGAARVHLGTLNVESQPIFNEDKTLCIFMEGEVFDYEREKEELKSKGHKFEVGNEPEFCLHLFEEYGENFAKKLNGSFIIVVYDIKNDKILIANDRYGLRPFYYTTDNDKIIFSSEVKAILQDKDFKIKINDEAVADFFAFETILGNKTFIEGINLLPPASILLYGNGRCSIKQYWDFNFMEEYDHSKDHYVENGIKLLKEAVEKMMKDDRIFGMSLSGGLDSRLISSLIDKDKHSIFCFTYGAKGARDQKFAKKVADMLGFDSNFLNSENHFPEFSEKAVSSTDGMLSLENYHQISLLAHLKENFEIMIIGIALGEMFGDFHFLDKGVFHIKDDEDFAKYLYKRWNSLINDNELPLLFSKEYYEKIKGKAFSSLKKEIEKSKGKAESNLNRIYYVLFKNNNMRTLFLHPTFIRTQIEVRMPQFDNNFVDFILSIPPELRFNRKLEYEILKKVSPKLAGIPFSRPLIDQTTKRYTYAAYRTFMTKLRNLTRVRIAVPDKVDYGEWIRESRTFFETILLDKRTLDRGYFNKDYIRQIVKDHMDGKKEYEKEICVLLTFELIHRMFIDKTT